MCKYLAVIISFMTCFSVSAQELADISLPAPQMTGGMPLMEALKARQSSRDFGTKPLSAQQLSDLLWAAWGINRQDSDKRTAPSARNWQDIEVYAVMAEGTYLYNAGKNKLEMIVKGDLRKKTGMQGFAGKAPLNLVFVSDLSRMKGVSKEDQVIYSGAHAGYVSQNVYLFCASEGLSTVVRGSVDREALSKAMGISAPKKIILVQTVGYPEKAD